MFEVRRDKFYRDGKEIKIISGAVHYFRIVPDCWREVFKKLRALGCNCVETYCAWNMHERIEGEYDFGGILDVSTFIKTAQEEGLMAIIRPGPYICAEWEFGGLPWWLQRYEDIEIRCSNEKYVTLFERYLARLFEEIRPLLVTNGGNVIMLQVENEYGHYGDDKEYLRKLVKIYRDNGIDVPLFTSDGPTKSTLLDGTIDGCYPALNFGSRVDEHFELFESIFPNTPKMCTEAWNGWFDAWGDDMHHVTSADSYAKVVDDILRHGSINMYMFVGGTNFGFMSGANHYEYYAPDVTSYDYDALLTECGDITQKYHEVRKVVSRYTKEKLPEIPQNREKRAYGKVALTKKAGLFDNLLNLSKPIYSDVPKNMEYYNQGYGYIAYSTKLERDYNNATLSFESIGDRAHVYINRILVGIVYVNDSELQIEFSANSGDTLTILVENMGRANFGSKMMRKKGIAGRCLIDKKIHFGWSVYTLPMTNIERLEYKVDVVEERACFYKGSFEVRELSDTFLELKNFKKGFVLINGFNIGRYWEIGPQRTLYVPSPLLKSGTNEIVVFECDGLVGEPIVEFVEKPDLG